MTAVIYSWFVAATGVYMFLFTMANFIYLRVVTRRSISTKGPKVSVLIPARNEVQRIGPTLESLKNQDYGDFEVIIIDDNSDDGTWDLIQEYAASDERFSAIRGKKLPEGWKGKPFAMQQLTDAAQGEVLLFIDADMRPEPRFISWSVTNMMHHKVDFLSGYARHTTPQKKEYLLFPVMYLATSFLLPLWLFRHSRTYMFSHAIGQFFCIKTGVLEKFGGFRPVKDKINEDIQMARFLKSRGCSQVFLDAKHHLSGNMYDSMEHAKMGIMRVVYEYFDNQIYPFVFMGLVMTAFLIVPVPLALGALFSGTRLLFGHYLGIFLVASAWSITMADRKLPPAVGLLYPFHFTWVIILSVHSIILTRRGRGYLWKGRTVH